MEKSQSKTRGPKSSKQQAESPRLPGTPEQQRRFPELLKGSHPTLDEMVRNGDSLTREEHLWLYHLPDPPPEPCPAELEVMLPKAFRR